MATDLSLLRDNEIPLPRNKYKNNKNSLRVTELVHSRVPEYQLSSAKEKSAIITEVHDQIIADLTFVKWDGTKWQQQDEEESRTLVQKCFTKAIAQSSSGSHGTIKKRKLITSPLQSHVDTTSQQQPVESTGTYDSITYVSKYNPPSMGEVITIDSDSLSWNDKVTREFLENLEKAMTSKNGLRHLLKQANNKGNESITKINQAMEIFLTKGGALAYQSLKKFLPTMKQQAFVHANELVAFLERSMNQQPHLKKYKVKNPAILLGYEENSGPQPKHCDTMYRKNSSEKVGILMLSSGKKGTIHYDMSDMRRVDSQEYPLSLNVLENIWADAPKSLFSKLESDPQAMELLQQYGQLMLASPDKRIEPGVVDQHSTLIIEGSNPHCAPAYSKKRAVIFFVLEPHDFDGEPYTGDTQMSQEKLCLMLYDELREQLEPKEQVFLLSEFITAIEESARLGASDETIDIGDPRLNPILPALRKSMASVHEMELLSSTKEKKMMLLKNILRQANNEHELAMKKWKQGKSNTLCESEKALDELIEATATYKEAFAEFSESVHIAKEERRKMDNMKERFICAIIGTDFSNSFMEGNRILG